MTTDKLAAGGQDAQGQPDFEAYWKMRFSDALENFPYHLSFIKSEIARAWLAARAGEGSQAAPLTQNDLEEMAVTWIATEPTISVSFGHVRENGVFQRLVNLLVQVRGAAAAGSGTFAAEHELLARWRKAVEGMTTFQTGWQKPYKPNDALAVEQCADELEAVLLAQEKREPAP